MPVTMPGMAPSGPMGGTAPATAMTPDRGGLRSRGLIMGSLALKLMERALPLLGAQSDEGQAFAKAIASLGRVIGAVSPDLAQAEVKMLGQQTGGVSAPSAQSQDAFRQMIQQKLSALPPGPGGGGAPGAAPPPAAVGAVGQPA